MSEDREVRLNLTSILFERLWLGFLEAKYVKQKDFCVYKLLFKILLKMIVFVWREIDPDVRVVQSNKYKYNFKDDILFRRISSIIEISSSIFFHNSLCFLV